MRQSCIRQAVSAKCFTVHAESVAEMARQVVFDAYGDEAYTRGLTVWTTIRRADQEAAYAAVRKGVHRLRPAPRLPRPGELREPAGSDPAEQEQALDQAFAESPDSDDLVAAVVLRGERRPR